jgi:hypothetical protein
MIINSSKSNIFYSLTKLYNLKNAFFSSYLYFYNLNFKINETSIITLDDLKINYLIPISTQQFYQKDSKYYKLDKINNTILEATDNEIVQKTFNVAFDELNLNISMLNNNSIENIIDEMIYKLESIINNNQDYLTVINLLENINNSYINIFNSILKLDIYGNTSKTILNNIDTLNNITNFFPDKTINLPISISLHS